MDSAMENNNGDSTPQSVKAAWQYCQQVLSASSVSEAWRSFKKMLEALPVWALVVIIVGLVALMTNPWIVPVLLVAGCVLTAVYFTVKHAVRAALREHDSQQRH